jgi:hypothetical protein
MKERKTSATDRYITDVQLKLDQLQLTVVPSLMPSLRASLHHEVAATGNKQ